MHVKSYARRLLRLAAVGGAATAVATAPTPAVGRPMPVKAEGRTPAALRVGPRPVRRATPNGLAARPPMGWNTYYGVGGNYDATTILQAADSLRSRGLLAAGYRMIWFDIGWWNGGRDAAGNMTVSGEQWPGGMRAFTDSLHRMGFLVGAYTDAGRNGCGVPDRGSYGHYQRDANQLAAWGFDAVKVDFCGGHDMHLNAKTAYSKFARALRNDTPHRAIVLAVCNPFTPGRFGPGDPTLRNSAFGSYRFGPSVANSWRTDTDVGVHGLVRFGDVLRNLRADAAHPGAAGPGHWNDPDYLAPELGMTATEGRTQFSMWAIEAAPLIIGSDVRALSAAAVRMLENPRIIAIDQDPAGVQGVRVGGRGAGSVWAKPLADGERAVAFLNTGRTALRITTDASTIGLPRQRTYSVENAWTGKRWRSGPVFSTTVAPHATVVLRAGARGLG